MSRPRTGGLGFALALALLAPSLTAGQEAMPQAVPQAVPQPPPPTARIEWREVEGARAYELEIRDLAGHIVFRGRSEQAFVDLALAPDSYEMRIVALNVFMKPASESPWMGLEIVRAVLPLVESLEPRRLPFGPAEAILLVRGQGIFRGSRVSLASSRRAGRPIRGEAATEGIADSTSGLAFRFELGKAALGDYDLVVENPGGMRTLVPAALVLCSPEEYWLGLDLPPLPAAEAPLPDPEPPLALGFGPVEIQRWGGAAFGRPARAKRGDSSLAPLPERRPRLSLGWSEGILLDPEFSYLYGPSYLGAALGFELPFVSLFTPPAFLRGTALEARLGFQSFPALLSAGAEGSIFFASLGGGPCLGTDFASALNFAFRTGAELVLTSLDSANPYFPGSAFSMDPAVYAGAALRFEYGRQSWELGCEWSGTFYLDFFMSRLKAGLSWRF